MSGGESARGVGSHADTSSAAESVPAQNWNWAALFSLVAVTLFASAWTWGVTGTWSLRSCLILVFLPFGCYRGGRTLTGLLDVDSHFALDFLLGSAAIGVVVTVLKLVLPLPFEAIALGVLALMGASPRWLGRASRYTTSWGEVLVVLLILAATTFWAQDLFPPSYREGPFVVFKPWGDSFTHASFVARLIEPDSLLRIGNYEWAGQPALLYHYASYVFPACLASMGQLTAYESFAAFWTPFGIFLTGLAAYVLGRALGGYAAGFAATVAVMLIPDPSFYHLGHPYYGYFWLQHVACGGAYGVAFAATALALILRGCQSDRGRWVVGGLILGTAVIFYKSHIFVASFPLLLTTAALGYRRVPWRYRCLGLSGCAVIAAVALYFDGHLHLVLLTELNDASASWYMQELAQMLPPHGKRGLFDVYLAGGPLGPHLFRAASLVLLSCFGLFLLFYPAVLLTAFFRGSASASDLVPLGALGILLLMTFGLGRNDWFGAPDEMQHRPFVWAYFVVAVFTALRGVVLFQPFLSRRAMLFLGFGCIGLLLLPWHFGHTLLQGKSSWSLKFVNHHVDCGLVECANFLRNASPTDARVLDAHLDAGNMYLVGLCQRRCFATRPDLWLRACRNFRDSNFRDNLAQVERLRQATTWDELRELVRQTGVRWYVRHPGDPCVWPARLRDQPAFQSEGYKVYDLQQCLQVTTDPRD
ncbi:hypothetical protein AYO40_02025 [Planctomycetaceae bacterium SCGC AG-212-D15]|nr:hypothetical protein AYO40_02025 [Planctomycetaceae bacterium SCGC AG-212-D15]